MSLNLIASHYKFPASIEVNVTMLLLGLKKYCLFPISDHIKTCATQIYFMDFKKKIIVF